MKTTLKRLRAPSLSREAWIKLLKHLKKTQPDAEPLSIATIAKSNGLQDALNCLRAVDGHEREIRLLGVAYARRVQHLMLDPISINAIDVSERYANGLATLEELKSANDAALFANSTEVEDLASDAAIYVSDNEASEATRFTAFSAAIAFESDQAWAEECHWQMQELLRVCDCMDKGIDPYPQPTVEAVK
jgi:hypothetical protein